MRQMLTSDLSVYVDSYTGNDGNNGSISAPWATLQYARETVQRTYDLAGFRLTYKANGDFSDGVTAEGPLVGQCGPNHEIFHFSAGSIVSAINPNRERAFDALYGAQFVVKPTTGNLTVRAKQTAGVAFAATAGGFINILDTVSIDCDGGEYGLSTSWGGTIIGNSFYVSGSMLSFIFASGGVIQLNPGNTTYVMGNPTYSKAFVWAYGGGVVGINGQTFTPVGTVTGKRYIAEMCGLIATGESLTYLPGSLAGEQIYGGQYQ